MGILRCVIRGKRSLPFLGVLAELVERGVAVRLIHAKEPGSMFRKDFDRYPTLIESDLFERALCPRVHTKAIIIDGKRAFITSANLTGAGLGAKHADKRNFEAGILTDERKHIAPLMEWRTNFSSANTAPAAGCAPSAPIHWTILRSPQPPPS